MPDSREAVVSVTLAQRLSDAGTTLIRAERRLDPYFRDGFNRAFQRRLARAVQWAMNLRRKDEQFGLSEERAVPDEEQIVHAIVLQMAQFMRVHYAGGHWERAGNTKT